MCGIAGYFSTSAREDFSQALRRMTDAIAHRGPNDVGYFESAASDGRARVGLGHRRLAIIDLSTGHQPLGNADGSVQIVFNGEIYNFEALRAELSTRGHLFRTRSDTEAIVHADDEWARIACRGCAACSRSPFGMRAVTGCFWHAIALARSRYSSTRRTDHEKLLWCLLNLRSASGSSICEGVPLRVALRFLGRGRC
jgi:glutamine phosphoribosylpyrophosphate amidotransferase